MDKKRVFVHATGKYLPGVLMVVASLSPWPALSQTVHDGGTVIESFLAPDAHAKPMARMWFPDASAGEDDNDNASDRIDAGKLLTTGQNTLTLRLNSTLYGRTYFEHSGYLDRGAVFGMGEGVLIPPVPGTYYNGLLGVSIIPYNATTTGDPDAIEQVPATDSQSASSPAAIYNLQGQRLSTPQRGVNIVGGTKIIAR